MRKPVGRRRRQAPDVARNDELQAYLVLLAEIPWALDPAGASFDDARTEPWIRMRDFESDQRIALDVVLRFVFAAVATYAERGGELAEGLAERVDTADGDRNGRR